MGEYRGIAEQIVSAMGENSEIRADDIPRILGDIVRGPVNCYPGMPNGGCHREAFFISLKSKQYAAGRGHLSFRKALECLVQHIQGHCLHTATAIIITDEWDPEAFFEWRANIKQIKSQTHVEAYLITNYSVTQMKI